MNCTPFAKIFHLQIFPMYGNQGMHPQPAKIDAIADLNTNFRAVLPVNNSLVSRIWPASSWPDDSLL